MAFQTVDEWLTHLERLHPQSIALGLERVAAVGEALALKPTFPIVTVGGTNGKGSSCAMLEAILQHAGYRVGCYTSPHLLAYNERVRIGQKDIADAALCRAFERVEAARVGAAGGAQLTYFEFGTLAAMAAFAEAGVDVAVLEVGLGGRLDAVNVFDADAALVTSIDLDHMDYLGDTREKIGFEKAHIYRPHRPAVCADPGPPESVERHARAIGAEFLAIGRDFGYEADNAAWCYWGPGGRRGGLPHPALRGAYQLGNAAGCLAVLDALRDRLPTAMQDVRSGLLLAAVPARFQVLPGRPAVILDVAHNPHAARALADNLARMGRYRRTVAVCAMLCDKDIAGVAAALASRIDAWYVAASPGPRGLAADRLAAAVRRQSPQAMVVEFAHPAAAYRAACNEAQQDDRILVFGSFLTVAEIMRERSGARAAGG